MQKWAINESKSGRTICGTIEGELRRAEEGGNAGVGVSVRKEWGCEHSSVWERERNVCARGRHGSVA